MISTTTHVREGGVCAMWPSAGVRVVLHPHGAVPQMPESHNREASP